ncbi:hypothetical protein V6N12_010794 [Hibiscus sabdariffa]|uniref:Endonuclease/exonuclease/phosphatase family protein n=1 Tax=Hibiscus sabdariffa TaxID=183260 RepID=A0ABR2EL66_9ROSI
MPILNHNAQEDIRAEAIATLEVGEKIGVTFDIPFNSVVEKFQDMNCTILSWNTRGLGRPEKRRSVVNTIDSCGAKVVFLQEMKISGSKSDIIRRMCGHHLMDV